MSAQNLINDTAAKPVKAESEPGPTGFVILSNQGGFEDLRREAVRSPIKYAAEQFVVLKL